MSVKKSGSYDAYKSKDCWKCTKKLKMYLKKGSFQMTEYRNEFCLRQSSWSQKKTQVIIFTLQPSNFFGDISIYFWKSHRFDFLHFLLHFWKNTFFVHISQFFVEYNEIYSRIFYYIWHTHSHQNIRFFKVFRRLMCKYSYLFF